MNKTCLLFAAPLMCTRADSTPSTHGHNALCTGASRAHTARRLAAAALAAAAVGAAVTSVGAYGLDKGRLQKCIGDQPCVSSTSVGNPGKFGPPWTFEPQTSDADVAWESLKQALLSHKDAGHIVELTEDADTYYLRAEFPSFLRGVDDVEMRLLKKDKLVTYRSSARDPIYVYPIQRPLNNDGNRTRLTDIRTVLGWAELGGDDIAAPSASAL